MNRQDFINLLHSKTTESNINKKFSVFSNITFDDSEHPYTMTQKLIQHHSNAITETTSNDNNTINQINSSDDTFSLIHNPINEHNKIIKKLNEKINTPEQLLTQSDINQILKECHKLNIFIPDEYQFFMNDSHKILNPYEDGILKAIFNKFPIGHTQKNKWYFAFNNKLDLLQWIKDAKIHKALIEVNAHITQYEINDSHILHSDMQNTFLIEKASVIQSKNYKDFL